MKKSLWRIEVTDRTFPADAYRRKIMTWAGNPYEGLAYAKRRYAGRLFSGWTATWIGDA